MLVFKFVKLVRRHKCFLRVIVKCDGRRQTRQVRKVLPSIQPHCAKSERVSGQSFHNKGLLAKQLAGRKQAKKSLGFCESSSKEYW